MTSVVLKVPKISGESSEPPQARRKATKRIFSSDEEDDAPAASSPPTVKRSRVERSPDRTAGSGPSSPAPRTSPLPAKSRLSKTRPSTKSAGPQKRPKVVVSDPESEEFDAVDDDSEPEAQIEDEDDEDEYMSEPKNPTKRGAGAAKGKGGGAGKGKKKAEPPKEIMARDERKRPSDAVDTGPAAKRTRTTQPPGKNAGEVMVDVVGDTDTPPPPLKDESAPSPKKVKLPPIKKNKAPGAGHGSSGAATTSSASNPPKPVGPVRAAAEEDSKLPAPITAARKQIVQASVDVDLSSPAVYAALFKSGGGSTPSGRHQKDEERRKELDRMRDEARAKRSSDATPAFDLQGQTDKIARFEERLKLAKSYSIYPNFLGGALKSLRLGNRAYSGSGPVTEAREEGEM